MTKQISVSIDLIDANPWQPREHEDPEAVSEIAASIQRNVEAGVGTKGLLQVPMARQVGNRYQLAFGHTRRAAFAYLVVAQGSGDPFQEMPLVIQDLTDLQMFEAANAENIKRKDLNVIEKATSFRRYHDDFGKSWEETAEFFNVSPELVRGKISYLKLAPEIQDKLRTGELNEADARKLLSLQRVAPQEAVKISKKIGPAMAGTLDEAIREVYSDNKKAVVEMWGRYHSVREDGKARAGEALWYLDWKHTGLEPLAEKQIQSLVLNDGNSALTTERREQIQSLTAALAAGMVVTPERFPDLKAEVVDLIIHLSNPPACTACPIHAIVDGGHYCGERRCWERKKSAWLAKELRVVSKKLGIAIYDPATDVKPVDVYDSTYGDYTETFKKRIANKDSDLRVMVRRLQEYQTYPATGHHWIAVVDLSEAHKKTLARKAEARREEKAKEPSKEEREKERKRERMTRETSDAFIEKIAVPTFADAFAGFKNVSAVLASIREDPTPSFKKLKSSEQIKRLQLMMADKALDHVINWQLREKGPGALAKHLQGVATTWGIKLPKDWLEKAAEWGAELAEQLEKE